MKVLILTNSKYRDFFSSLEPKNRDYYRIWLRDYEWKYWDIEYDIGISFMYQHKVPAKEVNSHTWFNFHPAPLPEYKGRNLCYWALLNGEKEFGATLHYMDENFDTGDIIQVLSFPVENKDTAEDLSTSAIEASKDLFKWYFPRILAGEQFERLPNKGGTYYKKNKPPILEEITLKSSEPMCQWIRAVTYKQFYPKLNIGGVTYKIVKDE